MGITERHAQRTRYNAIHNRPKSLLRRVRAHFDESVDETTDLFQESQHDRPHGRPSCRFQSARRSHKKRRRMRRGLLSELGRSRRNLRRASARQERTSAGRREDIQKRFGVHQSLSRRVERCQVRAMDKTVLDSIETAAKSLGQVQGKVKQSARMKELSKSLEIALKAARECTDDCAVEWETVEEISDAKEREQAKGN